MGKKSHGAFHIHDDEHVHPNEKAKHDVGCNL